MPASPPISQISQVIAAARSYVHFTDMPQADSIAQGGHNDHQVIAWAVLDDNVTIMPMIVSTADQKTIVQANQVSDNYIILNPYSQCQLCVRSEA